MSIKDTLRNVAARSGELIQTQRDDVLDDAEARLRKIADELAARIRAALLTSALIVAGGLLVLSAAYFFSR